MRTVRFLKAVALVGVLAVSGLAFAAPRQAASVSTKDSKFQRVGGDYKVAAVDRTDDGSFLIEFKSTHPTGKFDVLRLSSDHVHVAVKVGATLRLSAEILSARGREADVSQVVLFLPGRVGRVPVWLLSNKVPTRDLRATKYLEMHAPSTDYMVM